MTDEEKKRRAEALNVILQLAKNADDQEVALKAADLYLVHSQPTYPPADWVNSDE